MSAVTIITNVETIRVWINRNEFLGKCVLDIATNAGSAEFVLTDELLDELVCRLNQAQRTKPEKALTPEAGK